MIVPNRAGARTARITVRAEASMQEPTPEETPAAPTSSPPPPVRSEALEAELAMLEALLPPEPSAAESVRPKSDEPDGGAA